MRRCETENPASPAFGRPPRPVAPSSRISPPAPVDAPGNGAIAVGWLWVSTLMQNALSAAVSAPAAPVRPQPDRDRRAEVRHVDAAGERVNVRVPVAFRLIQRLTTGKHDRRPTEEFGLKWQTPQGEKTIRADDHQAEQPMYVVQVTGGKFKIAGQVKAKAAYGSDEDVGIPNFLYSGWCMTALPP